MKQYLSKKFRFLNTISAQLFLTYAATLILLLAGISVFVMLGFKNQLIGQVGAARIDVLKQIAERANSIKNSSITVSNLFAYNGALRAALQAAPGSPRRADAKAYLDGLKLEYDLVFRDIGLAYDVVVLGANGFDYSSRAGDAYDFAAVKKQLWYQRVLEAGEDVTFVSSFQDRFVPWPLADWQPAYADWFLSEESPIIVPYMFSAARCLVDDMGERIGVLLINIDEQVLSALPGSSAGNGSDVYIVDSRGNIVSHRDKNMLGLNFIDLGRFEQLYGIGSYSLFHKRGQEYLLASHYDEQTGWTIISEQPASALLGPLNQTYGVIAVAFVLCLAFALAWAWYNSRRLSRPLLKLCSSMAQVKQGDFAVISDIHGYAEVDRLKSSFNEMAVEIGRLMEEVRLREANKRRAELDFLRAQINPHFLYNTLFSIQCLVDRGQNQKAVYMIAAFTDLLKKTLSTDSRLIPLEEELQSTEKYLQLQRFRYGERIGFEMEADEGAARCMVPALILQPIVENAIFHGLEAKKGDGMIVLEARCEENRLLLSVTDDGVGMRDGLDPLRPERAAPKRRRSSHSVGIANVHSRIRLNFGEQYGVHIQSRPGIGTTVTLVMPLVPEDVYKGGGKEAQDENTGG